MSIRKSLVTALSAISMVVVPTVAQAAAADSLSLRSAPAIGARVGAETSDERAMGGSWILIGLAVVAVVVGIILITDDDGPSSP